MLTTRRTLRTCLRLFLSALVSAGPARAAAGARGPRPELEAVVLGKGAPEAPVGRWLDGGAYVLAGAGRDATDARHEGSFAAVATEASCFTFVARIAQAPEGTDDPQYGVSVRAGLDGTEKCVNLRYDGRSRYRCFRWLMRHHVTPSSHDGSGRAYLYHYDRSLTATEGVWVKIVRRYPYVRLYTSRDGREWTEFGADYLKALLPQKVWVGLLVTAGGDGKKAVSATYDHVSFAVDRADAEPETFADYLKQEYHPPVGTWRMVLATVETDRGAISPFLLMPKAMKPAAIRAILYSAGSKELVVDGKPFPWEKGKGTLRKPKAMDSWEGTLDIEGIRPFNQLLAHYGLVRVGGYFRPEHYRAAVERLAELSGIRFLPRVPFMVTGASFAGGASARAAALYPELTVASSPVIIGMAGARADDRRVLDTPHLHVFGSRDGPHLRDALTHVPVLREKHALWAAAPMWRVYHRQHKANALIYPYFLECLRLRLPERPDYARGPVPLKALREEDGWLGLVEAWDTSFPQAVPFREYRGESSNLVWLPSEKAARVWQAFVSENPKTIIHFPMFEGHETYGGAQPHGWRNSYLPANEPFDLVASGPLGKELAVDYYADLRKLRVLKGEGYRVTLEGLPPGLHSIYAITTCDGRREISRPVTILFQERKP